MCGEIEMDDLGNVKFLLSVIMPVYNVEPYLKRAIESVLCQSFEKFELLLIDDGSTDNCPQICDEFAKKDERIKVIHKRNGGLDSARNAGLGICQGNYLTFVDSDDSVEQGYFRRIYELSALYREVDLFVFGWNYIDSTGDRIKTMNLKKKGIIQAEDYIREVLSFDSDTGGGFTWNKVWKLDNLKGVKLFDESQWCFEDKMWNVEMLEEASKVCIDKGCFYNYMIRGDSLSHNKDKESDRKINAIETYKKMSKLKYNNADNKIYAQNALNTLIVSYLFNAMVNKEYKAVLAIKKEKFNLSFIGNIYFKIKTYVKASYIVLRGKL